MKKKRWLTAGIILALSAHAPMALAAEDSALGGDDSTNTVDVYEMDDTIVTATRTAKKDVDVPASTMVLTAEKIKESGATNAAEALSQLNGFTYKSFGANGASMGTMNNELGIRGNRNGTLVLVNGNPIAWRTKYNLEMIPAQNIERIEIVKGGGSVLYGSEAMAGVVNIILKKNNPNEVTVGFGNYGQQKYDLSIGDEILGIHLHTDKWDKQEGASFSNVPTSGTPKGQTRTDVHDIDKLNFGFNWNINPRLQLVYDFFKTEADYQRFVSAGYDNKFKGLIGEQFNNRKYTTEQHVTQLNYKDDKWKGNLYWNTGTVESEGRTYLSSSGGRTDTPYNSRERNTTYGFDGQRNWEIGDKSTAILGISGQHEVYQALPAISTTSDNIKNRMRNNWGFFGQWEQHFDAKNIGIFGLRETWTTGAAENYNNLSGSLQWLHKMNENNNLYASVNQSFIMPTFAQMFPSSGNGKSAPDLKPQYGINYEVGWKQNHNKHNWRLAIFHTDVTDNITANWEDSKSSYTYTNEDFRNTGIELSCDISGTNGWSYQYGVTWQNPETKSETKKLGWERTQGKLQLTGGITYKKDKWTSSLSGSYLCGRFMSPSSDPAYATKPYFLTSWRTSYAPDKNTEVALSVDNILDRKDNLSHSSSYYYSAPVNYLLSFSYKF
ncbi:MAG: TonB-dependent receptor plug domain-containing protein [Anaerovibrio sp.]